MESLFIQIMYKYYIIIIRWWINIIFLRITGFMNSFVVKGHIYYIKFGFSKFSKKQKQLYLKKKKYSNVINSN